MDFAKLKATLIVQLGEGKDSLILSMHNFTFLMQGVQVTIIAFACYRLFKVNDQPIFIRGGNWILSDGLLRLSDERYKTDIKFHADMNFNMIRCWGGGLAERPEFYHYCDIYGLLVRTPCGLWPCALFRVYFMTC